jgi:hypothetical protein
VVRIRFAELRTGKASLNLLFIQRAILIHVQSVENGAGRSLGLVLISRRARMTNKIGDQSKLISMPSNSRLLGAIPGSARIIRPGEIPRAPIRVTRHGVGLQKE